MKKSLCVVAVAGFAVLGFAAPAHAAANSAQNHTSYWENYTWEDDTCSKIEFGNGMGSFSLPALPSGEVYTLLVLKAGTENTVIPYPTAETDYWAGNAKGLSHAIYCVGERMS